MVDDVAEAEEREKIARARALKEDFPGSRNVPSTGLELPEPKDTTPNQADSSNEGDTQDGGKKYSS
ncbi:hypothetical protein FRC17_000692 [Serendipita sp. 399]|nr:hypothetical protein FRC17_000692 [Serendipita sp. 399]